MSLRSPSHPFARNASWMLCRLLIAERDEAAWSRIGALLPNWLSKELTAPTPEALALLHAAPPSPQETLAQIDPSWLEPILRSYSDTTLRLSLASLPQSLRLALQKNLRAPGALPVLTPRAATFQAGQLLTAIAQDLPDLVPPAYLPSSSLHLLWTIPASTLHRLPFFLGIYDLVGEMKKLIDNSKRRALAAALDTGQARWLTFLEHQQELVLFPEVGLNRWNGEKELLQRVILQRGLNRLAKVLCHEHPHLIWYVLHRFPMEEAQALEKLLHPLRSPQMTAHLQGQLFDTLRFVQKEGL